jgi:zinc transporter 2
MRSTQKHGHSHQQHDDEDDFKRPEDTKPVEHSKTRLELANETGRKTFNQLVVASIIAVIFLGCQLYGAHWSGSIAIMSDALHLASDLIGYVVAMTAVGFSAKQSTKRLSFGWHRTELVGTLISIFSIWWMSAFLV